MQVQIQPPANPTTYRKREKTCMKRQNHTNHLQVCTDKTTEDDKTTGKEDSLYERPHNKMKPSDIKTNKKNHKNVVSSCENMTIMFSGVSWCLQHLVKTRIRPRVPRSCQGQGQGRDADLLPALKLCQRQMTLVCFHSLPKKHLPRAGGMDWPSCTYSIWPIFLIWANTSFSLDDGLAVRRGKEFLRVYCCLFLQL